MELPFLFLPNLLLAINLPFCLGLSIWLLKHFKVSVKHFNNLERTIILTNCVFSLPKTLNSFLSYFKLDLHIIKIPELKITAALFVANLSAVFSETKTNLFLTYQFFLFGSF